MIVEKTMHFELHFTKYYCCNKDSFPCEACVRDLDAEPFCLLFDKNLDADDDDNLNTYIRLDECQKKYPRNK